MKPVSITPDQFDAIKPGDRFELRRSTSFTGKPVIVQMSRRSKSRHGVTKFFKYVQSDGALTGSPLSAFSLRLRGDRVIAGVGDMCTMIMKWEPVEYDRKAFKALQKELKAKRTAHFDAVKRIVQNHQYKKIDGVLVDVQTANLILKIHARLSEKNQARFEKESIDRLVAFAQRVSVK